ncbi:MAG: hypothetical protein U0791_00620 [Gemmataceae bacterium]
MAKGEGGGWRPGGGSGPVRRGPKADWMPTAQKPKSRKRPILIAGLFLLFAAILIGIWFLVEFLRPPSPPVLLIITTDPSPDAPNLHAPIDPYGWMSGRDLEKWSERNRDASTESERAHVPMASNGTDKFRTDDITSVESLADWVLGETSHSGQFRKPSDTAIIYFGLHTGADANRPYLYVNKGQRFDVEQLLQSISQKLASTKTKVLVMFDPARQTPEPTRGHLHDGFVQAMKSKEMNDALLAMGNITVILGCDEGERAWESEELKRTAFAHAVIQGLGGKATPTAQKYLSALDLYEYVRDGVRNWSSQNRPTSQNPVLLPLGDAGKQRAAGTTLMLHRVTEDDKPATFDPMPGLSEQWKKYGEAAARGVPGPEVYSPRHWRRYRELLIRYEQTVRSGHTESADAVARAMRAELDAIEKSRTASYIGASRTASAPMWQASGAAPVITKQYDSELVPLGRSFLGSGTEETLQAVRAAINRPDLRDHRMAYSDFLIQAATRALPDNEIVKQVPAADDKTNTSPLKRRAKLLRAIWADEPIRPPNVQLFLMLDQFAELSKEPWPVEADPGTGKMLWQRALILREHAEEAALGPVAADKHPYSEAVWQVVQDVVKSADVSRRRAEDMLFALPEQRGEIFNHFAAAEKKYNYAKKRAEEIRDALALRDEVMADLPFLGRWVVFEDEERYDPKPLPKLWADVHALAEAIDKLPPERAEADAIPDQERFARLQSLVGSVRTGYAALASRYESMLAGKAKDPVSLQNDWLLREKLLLVPPLRGRADPISMLRRDEIVRANRIATQGFDSGKNKTASEANDKRQRDINRRERAIALGYLALSELGKSVADTQKVENIKLSSWDVIGGEVNKINEKSWTESARVGAQLLEQHLALAKRADVAATHADAAQSERFSRGAVLPELRDGDEPAVINRNHRWQVLFAGQAHRTVLDHWYDEPESTRPRYYKSVSEAFLTPPAPTDKEGDAAQQKLFGMTDSQYAAFKELRDAGELDILPSADTASWTTERQRRVTFALTTKTIPPDSSAVIWAALEPKDVPNRKISLIPEKLARQLWPLQQNKADTLVSMLEPPRDGKAIRESATVRRKVFFRGQYKKADATAELKRVPDVIATHVRAQTEAPRVAFMGPNDIDVGIVSIIIDYSPSMTAKIPGQEKSRLDRLWEELHTILKGLPDGTKLRVRGFGVAPPNPNAVPKALPYETAATAGKANVNKDGKDPGDDGKTVYPGTFDRTVHEPYTVDWGANKIALGAFLQRLQQFPKHFTDLGPDKRAGVYSPVVRSMVNAVKEDFEEARDNQRKVLIVLTDGADNSDWVYQGGKHVGYSHDASLKALEKEFDTGGGRGVAAHIFLIKDELALQDKEIEKFQAAAKGKLGKFDPPGSIHFEEVDKFAQTLNDYLRPRVLVAADGRRELETHYRFDDPEPVRERAWWSDPLTELRYDTFVRRRPPDTPYRIELANGDRMLVRVSRPDPKQPPVFERLLWGQYRTFGKELIASGRVLKEPVNGWLMSIPRYRGTTAGHQSDYRDENGRHTLDLTAAVENKPAAGLKLLNQPAPAFAWWELASDTVRSPGATVYWWREYKNPAPSWRIRRWNWVDANDGEQLAKGKLTGWVESRAGAFSPRDVTTLEAVGEAANAAAGGEQEGRKWTEKWESPDWTVQFTWEMHRFSTDPDSPEPNKEEKLCLAVRIYSKRTDKLPDGKKVAPYFVQVDETLTEEHRFFREFGAYTGYFDLKGTPPDSAKGRRVRLYSVADLADPKSGTMLELPLAGVKASAQDPVLPYWDEPLIPQPIKSP